MPHIVVTALKQMNRHAGFRGEGYHPNARREELRNIVIALTAFHMKKNKELILNLASGPGLTNQMHTTKYTMAIGIMHGMVTKAINCK